MQLVRARLGREVEEAAEHLAVLGREVRRLHRELADRLDRRGGHGARPHGVVRARDVLPFQIDLEAAARRAVHARALVGAGDAGRKHDEAEPAADRADVSAAAAEVQRKRVDPIAADVDALFGVVRLQHRHLGGDADRLGRRADFEHRIHLRRLRDLHPDAGRDERLEAGIFDHEVVGARGQRADRVVAGSRRHGSIFRAGLGIAGDDDRSNDDGILLIGHSAGDRAAIALRVDGRRRENRLNGNDERHGELERLRNPHATSTQKRSWLC